MINRKMAMEMMGKYKAPKVKKAATPRVTKRTTRKVGKKK